MAEVLRVVDFGRVGALRSQTLWHAVAYGVSAGAPPTLSFVRPAEPYVCIGYHRRLDEVDLDACRRAGLPVYRRMVGGGPVYLDDGQLFFQIALPAAGLPAMRSRALRLLLEPAVAAFRASGVPAELDDDLEIVVDGRKVCGHGAGQVDDAVVVVGNLIERFDHDAAAGILRVPSDAARAEVLRLMRAHVAATPVDADAFRVALVHAYAATLDLRPEVGALGEHERRVLAELDSRFAGDEWMQGPARPAPEAWQAKVRAGVWVLAADHAGTGVVAGVVRGRVDRARVVDPELNGSAARVEAALAGCALDDAPEALAPFGAPGRRVAAALAKGDRRRL